MVIKCSLLAKRFSQNGENKCFWGFLILKFFCKRFINVFLARFYICR